jgi:hypothetical protein
MTKHLSVDEDDTVTKARDPAAPYGYKNDGVTPRAAPGRKKINVRPTVPSEAHAGPPLRRNNPRPPPREQTREMPREPSRTASSIIGRNGEVLERRMTDNNGDIFERVKPPPGWGYQWNSVTHHNKDLAEIHHEMAIGFHENGWRPVPASRHPGIWTPPGFEGAIVVRGQRLDERPLELIRQARAEDELLARTRLRNETDALRLTQAELPGATAGRAQKVSGIRMEIDKSFDLPPDSDYDNLPEK